MLHTKLLIRRLAYVPWLLAFGLVLGWAGEAQAQTARTILIDAGGAKVREDVGKTVDIVVTATVTPKDAAKATYVGLTITDNTTLAALNARYTIELGTVIVPKDKDKGTLTIKLTPLENTTAEADLSIVIDSFIGDTPTDTYTHSDNTTITLIDDDGPSTGIELTYGGAKINQDGDPTDVTVTASLDGGVLKENLDFTLLIDPNATNKAVRDRDYKADGVDITIRKGKPSGTATITITPLDVEGGNIELTTTDEIAGTSGVQVYGIIGYTVLATDGTANTNDTTIRDDFDETVDNRDYNRDGDFLDTDVDAVKIGAIVNQRIPLTVTSVPAIVIDPTKKATPDGVTSATVREDAGSVTIDLTVTLKNELSKPAQVSFTIEDPVAGIEAARRDIDYQAEFSSLTIPPGKKEGTATLMLTVIDNDVTNRDRSFVVVADVLGGSKERGTITITDNETPTDKITLEVDETKVEAGTTKEIAVTGTINGKRFEDDVTVTLVLAAKGAKPDPPGDIEATAQRDIDFDAVLRSLTIPAGQISGETSITISALKGGDKKVVVTQLESPLKNEDGQAVNAVAVAITLTDAPAGDTSTDPGALAFEESEIDLGATVFSYTVGKAIDPLELPDVMGGTEDDKTYSISALPAGLSFDAATQTISGTPTAMTEKTSVAYTVIDTDGAAVAQIIKIEVDAAPRPTVEIKSVSVTTSSVRESGASTEISVKATLAAPAPISETIEFTLGPPSDGSRAATRDVDYNASIRGKFTVEEKATEASTTLMLSPINNDAEDGDRSIGVYATAGESSASANVTIADDETASTSISLSADPHTVPEGAGATEVEIIATLNGKVLDDDEKVIISIANDSEATRDVDYRMTFSPELTIEKGAISGSITAEITPIADGVEEGSESVTLNGKADGNLTVDSGNIEITDAAAVMVDPLAFAEGTMIDTIEATSGTAITAVELPAASGGTGDISYSVSGLPAGLEFDAGTRMISGTPTEEGTSEVTYMAMAGEETVSLTFSITVNPPLTLDLSGLFGAAPAGKANPAHDPDAEETPQQLAVTGVVGQSYTLELPAGGTYQVTGLPAGLSLDGSTISGTPTEAGESVVIIEVVDSEGTVTQQITGLLVVEPAPVLPVQDAIVGQPFSLTLPGTGGTGTLTYQASGLPAGLSLDGSTISGTPTEVGESIVTVTLTDAVGSSPIAATFIISVAMPPLAAPASLTAQDYKGADGSGDNGGFVLLSWPLSEHHEDITGYRIFREIPALDGEYVPWAMVDPVPGVERGVAIVATLDNVKTFWGIAAERGRQYTPPTISGKAVFVQGENMNQSYELMAQTLLESREAAQAGNGPVFATLLPQALAFAQGAVPKLKGVEGVLQQSEMTITEERVGATDDIAPLAVPSLLVVDRPNDEGNHIHLTWTLSPSDQLLHDVLAGAIGPADVQPVVGVHGYGIYRRAAGEDELVRVGEVEAGQMSFVDETALHGVRYTYQVRAYDLDNVTPSDAEETAIAVRNNVLDSDGNPLLGLFGGDNSVGFDDFFLLVDHFGLTKANLEFDAAFDLDSDEDIDVDDFLAFADFFGRSTGAAGKRVPMLAGLNADARLYLDARTALPSVGEEFVLDVRMADFAAVKGYGLQVQYEADKLEFVEVRTDQPLGGGEFAVPQVLSDQGGILALAAQGDVVSEGEVELSLVFRTKTEIENTVVELTDSQTYDSAFGVNQLALPAPVQLQTRPEVFALANNYPNPFNPATTIKYALPQAADVVLTVYNVLGQPVRTLVAENQTAGRYVVEWDATNDSGHRLSSGMYFYRLQAGEDFRDIKKMLLLK